MVHPDKKAKLKLDENRIAALEALGFTWSNDASFDLEKHKAHFVKKPSAANPDFSSAIEAPYPENWGAV